MNKNEVFTFTAPNGAEVTAVVIDLLGHECGTTRYLCYAQNRLFTGLTDSQWIDTGEVNKVTTGKGRHTTVKDYPVKKRIESPLEIQEILVDYCILPDYDDMLEAYSDHQVTLAEEQSGM